MAAARLSWTALAVSFATATAALAGTIGPDARWLAALGRLVVEHGRIPSGLPFASAPSADWLNVPVLAELLFHGLVRAGGDRGLLVAQLVAIAIGLGVTGRAMRRAGATDAGAGVVLALLVPGALLTFAGIKAQLFSLALFPLLVALLRADARRPSRRIWLLPPLLALWSNLHGAVLVGLGVALAYLLLHRGPRRRRETAALAAASTLAICLTPALARTPRYYAAVTGSEAAKRGYGLWAPLSPHSGFDLLLAGVAVVLLVAFLRARPRSWELVVAAILAATTVHAARNGIWLLLFVAAPAATALRIRARPHPAVGHGVVALLGLVAAAALVRGPLDTGAPGGLIRRAVEVAHGAPILAEPAEAEQVVAAGGRVWISNPLDAFRRADQRAYLDWLQGRASGDRLVRAAQVVVVASGSPAARRLARDPRLQVVAETSRGRVLALRAVPSRRTEG